MMHQEPSGPGVAVEKSTIPEKSGFSGSFGPGQQYWPQKRILVKTVVSLRGILPVCCSCPMSGAGSAAGSARRGTGSSAREAIEARRHGLAACRDHRNKQVSFSIHLLLFFMVDLEPGTFVGGKCNFSLQMTPQVR